MVEDLKSQSELVISFMKDAREVIPHLKIHFAELNETDDETILRIGIDLPEYAGPMSEKALAVQMLAEDYSNKSNIPIIVTFSPHPKGERLVPLNISSDLMGEEFLFIYHSPKQEELHRQEHARVKQEKRFEVAVENRKNLDVIPFYKRPGFLKDFLLRNSISFILWIALLAYIVVNQHPFGR